MFTDRDIKMTKRIETFLKGDQTVFVVVGTGHLVGEESIVAQLKNSEHATTVTRQ